MPSGELPKTSTGKIQKFGLRDKARAGAGHRIQLHGSPGWDDAHRGVFQPTSFSLSLDPQMNGVR
jgi:hypothetical protein